MCLWIIRQPNQVSVPQIHVRNQRKSKMPLRRLNFTTLEAAARPVQVGSTIPSSGIPTQAFAGDLLLSGHTSEHRLRSQQINSEKSHQIPKTTGATLGGVGGRPNLVLPG